MNESLCCVNDLDDVAMFIEILKKFADDKKLGHTAATPEDRETLQLGLDILCDCGVTNGGWPST
jgi:hypothetical protein